MVGTAALWPLVQWCAFWLGLVDSLAHGLLRWLWCKLLQHWPFKTGKPPGHFRRKATKHVALDTDLDRSAALDTEVAQTKPFKPYRVNRKPEWVITEVLRIKARSPKAGCRKVAQAFNQKHGPACTVSKSFVADCLKRNQYALWCARREIQNKKPTPYGVNAVWAMDLTFQADQTGAQQSALGIIDHGSRALLCLQTISNKNSWTLLGQLCLAMGQYAKPKAVRTDNESVFTGKLFKLFYTLTGIRHQRIERGWSSSAAELPRHALTEPYVTVSRHTALVAA